MDAFQAPYVHDQLNEETFSDWQSVLRAADPEIDNYWQHPPQQEAATKVAAQLFGSSCGQSQSGSSAFSSDPRLDSAVLNNWHDNLLEPVPALQQQQQQQAQLPVCLSQRNSTQSNQLPGIKGPQMERGHQPGPAEPQSGSWQSVVFNEALARAASRICEEEEEDLDQALEMIRQEQQQQQHQKPLQHQQPLPDVLQVPRSNLQGSNTSDAAPCSPQLSGSGTSQGAPASPTYDGEKSAAGHSSEGADGGEGGIAGSSGKPVLPHVALKVACGDMFGTLMVHRAKIIIGEGTKDEKEVSPTEFERLGGRSATKKWKQSIRLVQDDGELGRPVGEWYIMQGLEQPKKAREAGLGLAIAACPVSPPDRQHGSAHKATHRRPIRAAARHVSAHVAAEAAGSPEAGVEDAVLAHYRGASHKGAHSRTAGTKAAAKAAAARSMVLDATDMGAVDTPHDVGGAISAAATSSNGPDPERLMLPQQQQQQFNMQSAASMLSPASSNAGASEDALEALDTAALGEYHMPPGAVAAAAAMPAADMHSGPLLVPVPVAHPLPGDASQAVVEMTAYLEGRRSLPPWRLLPAGQRPLLGQYLVPLRQLFVLVMQAGGYVRIKDDLLMWQDMAVQMGLPAWPCPSVPDPLRALQQVYRDYLLRFEGRFTLPESAGAAGTAAHHSPTLSTATQYAGSQQQQQAFGATGDTNHNSSIVNSQQQMQVQCSLPPDAAAVLEDTLSGDLLEFLSELIPDTDAAMPAAASAAGGILRQPSLPGASIAPAAATQSFEGSRLAGDIRQHPEMEMVQQRQRFQQLQQQLQQLRQQQQQLQQQQHRFAPVQSGTAEGGALRMKRPPPLIRCGDSDVVTLVDQSELSRLLRDYEEQQHGQQPVLQRQQQLMSGTQSKLPPSGRATSSQLAAAIAGAVDRNQSQDLQAIMQQFWTQQGHPEQCNMPAQQQQQSQQPLSGNELEPQPAEEEMSGMLEALQLAADGTAVLQPDCKQQQHADMLGRNSSMGCNTPGEQSLPVSGSSADIRNSVWSNHLMPPRAGLLAQGSVGAHLVSMMPTPGVQQATGAQQWQPQLQQQQQAQGDQGMPPLAGHPMSGLRLRQDSPSGAAVGGYQDLQQQQQPGDTSSSSFRGGLMRLTTPSSMLIGAVLDSPTMRNSGQAWMDVSAALPNTFSTDLKSMTVELLGADAGQAGPADADLSAVLRMW